MCQVRFGKRLSTRLSIRTKGILHGTLISEERFQVYAVPFTWSHENNIPISTHFLLKLPLFWQISSFFVKKITVVKGPYTWRTIICQMITLFAKFLYYLANKYANLQPLVTLFVHVNAALISKVIRQICYILCQICCLLRR